MLTQAYPLLIEVELLDVVDELLFEAVVVVLYAEALLQAVEDNLPVRMRRVKLLVPFKNGGVINEIREKATLISEEYVAEGIAAEAIVDEIIYSKVKNFEVKGE